MCTRERSKNWVDWGIKEQEIRIIRLDKTEAQTDTDGSVWTTILGEFKIK